MTRPTQAQMKELREKDRKALAEAKALEMIFEDFPITSILAASEFHIRKAAKPGDAPQIEKFADMVRRIAWELERGETPNGT